MSSSHHSHSPLSGLSPEDNEPVFQAPWEARAFAIVNQLAIAQEYSWSEWTEQLVGEIAMAEAQTTGASSSYYERWVQACEKLLIAKGILDDQSIEDRIKQLLVEHGSPMDHDHLKT